MLARLLLTGMMLDFAGNQQAPDPEPVLRDSVRRPRPVASAPT